MSDRSFDFRQWIQEQKGPYTFIEQDRDHFRLETEYGEAEVNFYALDAEPEVVELRITCKKTNTTRFFLHFQPTHEEHSKDLFKEMVSSLLALRNDQTTKVLLCCSAGMTTSFFAEKLNETARMLGVDFAFHAVGIREVYANAADYDVILVAPQVGYEEKNLKERIPHTPVLRIPTSVFASYDAGKCIAFIQEEMQKKHAKKKKKEGHCCACCVEHKEKFLVIATAPTNDETRIRYRIYDHGIVSLDREVIKRNLDLKDIDDIMEVQLSSNSSEPFDAIAIALPGVLQNGVLDLPRTRGINLQNTVNNLFDVKGYFQKKTEIPVVIENNANCAAVGWYYNQTEYKDICLMSQPNGWMIGGQGIIVNGKLIRGAHGIAGEIKHIMNYLQIDSPLSLNAYSVDSIRQIVAKAILTNISILDPEVVVIRCDMLPDMEEVHEELRKYLPDSRIPHLVHIEDFNEYVLMGQEALCIDYLKEKGKEDE